VYPRSRDARARINRRIFRAERETLVTLRYAMPPLVRLQPEKCMNHVTAAATELGLRDESATRCRGVNAHAKGLESGYWRFP